ncbi:hypothetical protein Q8G71_31525, partial [Klebsiella pneumoniae]
PGEHICHELAPALDAHKNLQNIQKAKLFLPQPESCCQKAVLLVRWKQQQAPSSLASTKEPQKSVALQNGPGKSICFMCPCCRLTTGSSINQTSIKFLQTTANVS